MLRASQSAQDCGYERLQEQAEDDDEDKCQCIFHNLGDDDFFNARSFQVFITRLRRALSRDPRLRIVNVRGTGYKLIAE